MLEEYVFNPDVIKTFDKLQRVEFGARNTVSAEAMARDMLKKMYGFRGSKSNEELDKKLAEIRAAAAADGPSEKVLRKMPVGTAWKPRVQ